MKQHIARLRGAISRYGSGKTFGHGVWFILWKSLGKNNANRVLGMAARLFSIARIHHVKTKVNNVSLWIDPTTYWSLREYALALRYDEREITASRRHIPREYTFVDIGANFGAWTFSLLDHFHTVIAIEPDPNCFACLTRTSRATTSGHPTLVNAALSDQDGETRLFQNASHLGDSRIYDPHDVDRLGGIPVAVHCLDTLFEQQHLPMQHLFIKLDAQGVEPRILRGMARTLQQADDVIIYSEINAGMLQAAGESADGYISLLQKYGFKPVDLLAGLSETTWEAVRESTATNRDHGFRYTRR